MFINLLSGRKLPALVTLDAVLQNLTLTIDDKEDLPCIVPVLSVAASGSVDEDSVLTSKGFMELDEADVACTLIVKFNSVDGKKGYWFLIEPTVIKKERLVEAFAMLSAACRVAIEI